MASSPDAPKQTDEQRKAEALQIELMKKQLDEIENAEPLKLPKYKPPAPAPPPPMQTSGDIAQAEQEARRNAGQRTNTARGTLFARETGGYQKPKATLLG